MALAMLLGACTVLPEARRQESRQQMRPAPPVIADSPSARQCLSDLGAARADFTPLADRYFGLGCSTRNSVRLSALQGDSGRLGIANLGPVACPLANTFAAWARYGVDRAARQILGSPLLTIETMGSYACRNVAGTERRSAHASAEAIDVSAFLLADGRRISVANGWNGASPAERHFLRVVHESACRRFGTVLGPQYNAAHRDHFHLETGGQDFCR